MWSGSSSHHCPYLTHTHTQAITTRARKPSCPRNTDCIRKIKVCCQRCYPCLPTDIPGIWGFAEKRPLFRKPRHIDRINLERCDSEPNFILGLQPTPASQKGWHKFLKKEQSNKIFSTYIFFIILTTLGHLATDQWVNIFSILDKFLLSYSNFRIVKMQKLILVPVPRASKKFHLRMFLQRKDNCSPLILG